MFLASKSARQLVYTAQCISTRGHHPLMRRFASNLASIQLRDYQEECINAVLAHIKLGHKRMGVSLATGSGKTVIFTILIDRIPNPNEEATQTLILAHRRELVEQAARHCSNAYPSKTIDIELGNSHASGSADITIASVQSLMSKGRIDKYDPTRFKLVLVDEAHHIVAPKYLEILNHFGLRPLRETSPVLVGVSATFSRFDGLKLGTAIDHIVYHKDYVDMIKDGWLSDVIFTTVRMKKANLEKVATGVNGDFLTSALSREVNNPENNDAAVRVWLSRCAERKSTIVFCIDVQHIVDMTATFKKHGIVGKFVTGETHRKVRADTIEAFKKGEFPVLLNCGVFTEGTDIPNIDCVLLYRPTKSRNLLVQMIGRGMRLHSGKTDCHVIDMISSLKTGIVTAPTLYGLDPDELVEGASPKALQDLRDAKAKDPLSLTPAPPKTASGHVTVSFIDYDSIMDLIEDTSGERHIRAISRFAWVQTQDDVYVLSGPNGSYIRLSKEDGTFIVKYVAKLKVKQKSPFARPRIVASGSPTFEHAVHAADAFADKIFTFTFIDRNQAWRQQPATEAQIQFVKRTIGAQGAVDFEELTKGRAVDMITKIKHGARGRFDKIQSVQRKAEKAEQFAIDAAARQRREVVQVGPLNG